VAIQAVTAVNDNPSSMWQTEFTTTLGTMVAVADADTLYLLEFAERPSLNAQLRTLTRHTRCRPEMGTHELLHQVEREVGEYLDGTRRRFELPIATPGTDFQREVWAALCAIPYGQTRSYSELARAIERPRAVRAVGAANGANRLALVVPCHRLVGADGSLTGYAGGTWRKQHLLAMERRTLEAD